MKQQGTTLVKAVWRNNKTEFFKILEFGKKIKDLKAELAALKGTPTTSSTINKTITKKRIKLKNPITDFSKDAQALLNNPNPTIEEYNSVVGNYEFDLSY